MAVNSFTSEYSEFSASVAPFALTLISIFIQSSMLWGSFMLLPVSTRYSVPSILTV